MKRLERILAALTPKRWPVRWRLAAVSATLTLVILVIFAVVVGRLTSNRLQSDFNDELRDTAARSPAQVDITQLDQRAVICRPTARPDARAGRPRIRVVTPTATVGRRRPGRPPPGAARRAPGPRRRLAARGHDPLPARPPIALRPVRPQHGQPRRDDQPAVAVPRGRRARRHRARGSGGDRDRGARDAAGLRAHRQGAGDRLHARPFAAHPRAGDRRRGRRAGAHPGADAPASSTRRARRRSR